MAMPVRDPFLEFYIPGIGAFIGGIFTIGTVLQIPLLFLAWFSNFLLLIGYYRGLITRKPSKALAVVCVVLSSTIFLSEIEFRSPFDPFNSPAYLVWVSSQVLFLMAEFAPGEKTHRRLEGQLRVNGRLRPLFNEADLLRLLPGEKSYRQREVVLQGNDDTSVLVHFNESYGYAKIFMHKGDPGQMTLGNLEKLPESQVFRGKNHGDRTFPGLYLITHEQGIDILKHFAQTGAANPGIQWSSGEELATELDNSPILAYTGL